MAQQKNYIPRIIDKIIAEKLDFFGAVNIAGCKWCGKSTTAEQFAKSIIKFQDPENNDLLQVATNQPSMILDGAKPRLIDEWQDAPEIWDAVRTDVDHTSLPGQYILTGSSTPRHKKPRHSGAGRIATVTMRPMSLYESGDSNGAVSLSALFNGASNISGNSSYKLEDIAYFCTRGGWPLGVIRHPKNPSSIAREYLEAISEREGSFGELEYYSPGRMRALLRSLARGVSGPSRLSTIVSDIASSTGTTISDVTVANYISILEKNYIIDDVEAWCPQIRSKTEIRTGKKRNLVDPSLAVATLYASENDLLQDFSSFGLIFESLAMRDLRIYAEPLEGELLYYRDKSGLECDAIIHLVNGRWGAIEVKLGSDEATVEAAAKSLMKMQSIIDDTKMPSPSFLMVLSGIAKYAYRRQDGVFVVPIGCLRP